MEGAPARPISDSEVERFRADGIVHLKGIVGRDWVDILGRGVEKTIAHPGPLHTVQTRDGEKGYFLSDLCMAQQIEEYRTFMLNGPAPAIAARLMGASRVNFFADTLWVKDGGTEKRTRWHQDQPFFWVDGQMCVIWFPLDSVAKENALELIRGSHRWGKSFAPELSRDGRDLYATPGRQTLERMPDIQADRSAFEILAYAVEPGDCIAFDGLTVHGAAGNGAAQRRRAVSSIWMGESARYAARPAPGRPHFEGHGLKPGDAMDCDYFPRVWPRRGSIEPSALARFADRRLKITK
ncbi:MAG: phytanoyl-CoA dioxygenase family protein [Alphaproteobacteria bacterium]